MTQSAADLPPARDGRVRVVLKRSAWRRWVEEEPDPKILELLEAGHETVARMRLSHEDHAETIEEVRTALRELGVEALWSDVPYEFQVEGACRLVITVGGDGTLLAASHGVGRDVPLLGVNSAPRHSVGFFCGAQKGGAKKAIQAALAGGLSSLELARMSVERNGVLVHDRILNEALFCHPSPAATSRYILRLEPEPGDQNRPPPEEQKSSGLWVGPAAGSTAAQRSAGGEVLPITSQALQYVVRELYIPRGKDMTLRRGVLGPGQALRITSKMRRGCLFVDGDHLVQDVAMGDVLTMRRSDTPITVLGL